MVTLGTSILWMGWFRFNGGSIVGASYNGFGLTQYKGIDGANDNLELSGIEATLVHGDYKDSNKYHSITLAKSIGELDYVIVWNKYKPTDGDSESHVVFSIGKSF